MLIIISNIHIFGAICSNPLAPATKVVKALSRPKHNGEHLHKVVREKLQERRLHEALTNIVIPTFDIKYLQPTIFSSYQVSSYLSIVNS